MPTATVEPVVIRPSSGWIALDLRELWTFRELAYFLVWRDVKVRYKQTVLGAMWAILQPFLLMVIFAVVLGRLGHLPSDGRPYAIFAYAGLVPWTLFATALTASSDSLVGNANLVSKVYFPRLLMPLAAALAPVVDFCIALTLVFGMMALYGITPSPNLVFLPALVLLALLTALAVGVWVAALNVRFRDFRHAVPFLVQLWLFATPVAYSSSLVPASLRPLLGLNPMAGVTEGFRWALLGTGSAPGGTIALSTAVTLLVLLGGLVHFRRVERSFADVI